MRHKPTRAQVERRVAEVLRIRLDGAEFWDVCEYVREKEREDGSPWRLADGQKPLSDSQLWRYLGKADRLIAESCRASRRKLLRRHLAQRRNLFAKAASAGDYRAALACLRDEAQLLGLYDAPRAAAGPAPPCAAPADVTRLLAAALADLRAGRIDSRSAAAVGTLAGGLLRSMEAAELQGQLDELRRQLEEVRQNGPGSAEAAGVAAGGGGGGAAAP